MYYSYQQIQNLILFRCNGADSDEMSSLLMLFSLGLNWNFQVNKSTTCTYNMAAYLKNSCYISYNGKTSINVIVLILSCFI